MDNYDIYMALIEEKFDEIIRPERRSFWCLMRQSGCADIFAANSIRTSSPRKYCNRCADFDKKTPAVELTRLTITYCYTAFVKFLAR